MLVRCLILFMLLVSINCVYAEEEISIYDDSGKRDPFWPIVTSTGVIMNYDNNLLVSEMMLEGVILGSADDHLAIINGIIVKTNEDLGNYKVKKINKDSVILIKDEERFILKLKKED